MKTYTVRVGGIDIAVRRDNDGKFVIPDGWRGLGSAIKPALEPICLARKPLIGTIAQNVLAHSTGALNIDGCRVDADWDNDPTRRGWQGRNLSHNGGSVSFVDHNKQLSQPNDLGRWPANVLHDSSLEVLECFAAEDRPAIRFFYSPKASAAEREEGLEDLDKHEHSSRSLYAELPNLQRKNKENRTQRANHHPTVKPVDLMAWLVRLITPPKGIVLDPFMGSGSTGIAAVRQGFRFIGIEQSEEYFEIAVRRIRAAYEKPDLFAEQPKPKAVQTSIFDEAAA